MKKLKVFEDFTTINFKDLVGGVSNWSAKYHVNKANGKKPYIKQGDLFISFDDSNGKKSLPKDALYLTDEEAIKLNEIGQKLILLKKDQQDLLDSSNEILNNIK